MNIEPRQLLALMQARRSVREFTAVPPTREQLDMLMEAARWAPSPSNKQSYRFLLLTDPARITALAESVRVDVERVRAHLGADIKEKVGQYMENFHHFSKAPCVLVAIHRPGMELLQHYVEGRIPLPERSPYDSLAAVSAAIMNVMLMAESLGLATCWMTGPLAAGCDVREELEISGSWQVAAIIPVGYAQSVPEAPPRRSLKALVRWMDENG